MKEVSTNWEGVARFMGTTAEKLQSRERNDMRLRLWKEHAKQRTITTPEGPVFAYEGEIVVVAVVKNGKQAAALLAQLDEETK